MSEQVFQDRIFFMSKNHCALASCYVVVMQDRDGYKINCNDFNGLSEKFDPILVLEKIASVFVW